MAADAPSASRGRARPPSSSSQSRRPRRSTSRQAKHWARQLAELGPRPAAARTNARPRRSFGSACSKLGYNVRTQRFFFRGRASLAECPSARRRARPRSSSSLTWTGCPARAPRTTTPLASGSCSCWPVPQGRAGRPGGRARRGGAALHRRRLAPRLPEADPVALPRGEGRRPPGPLDRHGRRRLDAQHPRPRGAPQLVGAEVASTPPTAWTSGRATCATPASPTTTTSRAAASRRPGSSGAGILLAHALRPNPPPEFVEALAGRTGRARGRRRGRRLSRG